MGQHVWLLLATIITELLVIAKWRKGQFPEPLPSEVKWGWVIGATLLVLYPTVQVGYVLIMLLYFPSLLSFILLSVIPA